MSKLIFYIFTFLIFVSFDNKNDSIEIFISRNEKGIPDCSKAIRLKAKELTFIKCTPASAEQLSQIKNHEVKVIDDEFIDYLSSIKESEWIQIRDTQKAEYKKNGCNFNQYVFNIKITSNDKTKIYRIYDMENCQKNSLFFIITNLSNKFREYESSEQ